VFHERPLGVGGPVVKGNKTQPLRMLWLPLPPVPPLPPLP